MINPLITQLREHHKGIASYCTANELVIEALLEDARDSQDFILIEGTANQINQFGGYTGMTPEKFRNYVFAIADRTNFPHERIILGADHFGPLVWSALPESQAMNNAMELVRLAVLAGFTKIHLDTSMKLADDPIDSILSDEVIAERGAVLLTECEAAYQELLRTRSDAVHPVYIIGSEVPIPGGTQTQEEDSGLQVTRVRDFEKTLETYRSKFESHGISERWHDVIAVVVQPGVEFGDRDVHEYDRESARELCIALRKHPDVCFEGHSTDYQTLEKLSDMVSDGVKILKVGPALTFALREGLFALSMMERELIPEDKRADFIETLERVMLEKPANWSKHYHGSEHEKYIARKYSYSDRSRYYMSLPEIHVAIKKLFANLDSVEIPAGLLSQYMPLQYKQVRAGKLEARAEALAKYGVVLLAKEYNYAVNSRTDTKTKSQIN